MKRGGCKFGGSKTGAVLCPKRGAVVSQLVVKLKESVPPPPRDLVSPRVKLSQIMKGYLLLKNPLDWAVLTALHPQSPPTQAAQVKDHGDEMSMMPASTIRLGQK